MFALKFCVVFLAIIGGFVVNGANIVQTRIIGGKPAGNGAFPYVVSVRTFGSHLCSGAILSPDYIVTTAACVVFRQTSSMSIVAGSTTLDRNGDTHEVTEIIYHPRFGLFHYLDYNIALLKLKTPITYNNNKQKIAIARQDFGEIPYCLVAGHGTQDERLPFNSNQLRIVQGKTIRNEECRRRMGSLNEHLVRANTICVDFDGTGSTCYFDDAATLECFSQLVGLLSDHDLLCDKTIPDAFVKISQFAEWISQYVKEA